MSSIEFVSDFGNPVIDLLINEGKLNSAERAAIENAKALAASQPRQPLGNSLSPSGSDTYRFQIGDGADIISDSSNDASTDRLVFTGTGLLIQLWY